MASIFQLSRKVFTVGLFTVSAAALLMLGGCDSGGKGGRTKAVNTEVEVMTVRPQEVEYSRMITGRIDPVLLAEVRPQVSGILMKRMFEEGSDVKEGQVLYLIDDAIYKAAYKSAQAALNKVEANNNVLKVKRERFKAMLARKAVSQQDFDDLDALYKSSCAEVRVQKALVDEARIQYEYTRIKAPISGRIGLSNVTPGALVTQHQGAMLASIHQLDPIHVKLTMSASELSSLRRKMAQGVVEPGSFGKVRLFFDDGTLYDHEGVVDFSDAAVAADTGSVTLRATFENPDHLLMPNMAVRAELVEGRAARALMVPQPAVSLNADGSATVFILGKDNVAELRTVVLAGSKGRSWQVISGLEPGEKIITNGLRYVKAGMKVTLAGEGK
ncbi:MAG: efflux RND transporter periplasmic adaptor subunit [Mailhella sp.]|nr:efflux RND transporter periplasmic adaptor subunit [Mailhella sp.]MBQ9104756.1 efflux RND transporter periplasmic adaptor subunit [Mailhella sp.]